MLEVTRAFPIFIGRLPIPDAEAMNLDLRMLIVAEEASIRLSAEAISEDGTRGAIF